MSRLKKSILGAALCAGLAAIAVVTPTQSADARPVWGPHGHWVHGWHGGRFDWWRAWPDYWYWAPSPVFYDYPPPPGYVRTPGPAPQPTWYYCDSAKGYYPYIRSCASGWRAVAANEQEQSAPTAAPPASGATKS
jgi:hypothetical protein